MTTITIDDLRHRLDEVIDRLARGGEPVAVIRDGVQVAALTPTAPTSEGTPAGVAPRWNDQEVEAYLARWDRLAHEVGKTWPEGVTALDAVLEQRREL